MYFILCFISDDEIITNSYSYYDNVHDYCNRWIEIGYIGNTYNIDRKLEGNLPSYKVTKKNLLNY